MTRVNVTKGDYTADPTGRIAADVEFQKAVTKLLDVGGGTLFIPRGIYQITAPIEIDKINRPWASRAGTASDIRFTPW